MPFGALPASNRPVPVSVSVIVCTLNEEHNVVHVFSRMPPWLDELIVVDGRSKDRTIDVVKATAPHALVFIQNGQGKGNALRCGIAASTGDIVITMDADGSHDPAEISRYVTKVQEGHDLVKGSRFLPGGGTTDMPRHRVVANRFLTWLSNVLSGTQLTDISYGFYAFRGAILRQMPTTRDGFEMETEVIMRFQLSGLRVAEVPSFESGRLFGTGKLQSVRDGYRIMSTILAFGLRRLVGRSFNRAQDGDSQAAISRTYGRRY